jgi:hypothetical protein
VLDLIVVLLDLVVFIVELMGHNTQGTESERNQVENMVGSSDGVLRKSNRERTAKLHFDQQYVNQDNVRCRQTVLHVKRDGHDSDTTVRPQPIKNSEGQLQWEVEKILEEKQTKAGIQMLVKWTGFDDVTWEPESYLPKGMVAMWRTKMSLTNREGLVGRHGDNVLTYQYKGTDVIINEGDEEFVENGVREFAQDLVDGLQARFPPKVCSVLSAFDIFHLDSIPEPMVGDNPDVDWDTYGNSDLDTLIDHYSGPGSGGVHRFVKRIECHVQWSHLRNLMKEAKKNGKETTVFWSSFLQDEPVITFPDIRRFVELFLVIVLSSVECERHFSQMNLTKSLQRARMLTGLLNDLLMIKLNGPDCQGKDSEEFTSLIERTYVWWKSLKFRNPKRSRTAERPERRKRKKTCLDDVRIDRSIDNNDSHQSGEQSDDEDDLCMCGVNSMSLYSENLVMDDLATFTPRCVYIPPDGWGVMDRTWLDSVPSSRERIKTLTRSNTQQLKLSIQFPSGWATAWYCGIEEGLCPLHYKDNVGWVWLDVRFQHKSGIHPRLCNLHPDWYGMDEQSSWCVIEKCGE